MTRRAFTLIELLVVIAIIAILAAILFPVFAKVREKARQTSCASNIKQVGLAMLQYQQDSDEAFPGGNNAPYHNTGWIGPIYPYVKSIGLFKCPDDPNGDAGANFPAVSYHMNLNLMPGSGAPNYGRTIALADIGAPAMTVFAFETQGNHTHVADGQENESGAGDGATNCGSPTGNGGIYATGLFPGMTTGGGCVNQRLISTGNGAVHTEGANYLASDGHVKYLRPSRLSPGRDADAAANAQDSAAQKAAGTGSMDNGTGSAATMTFSKV